MITCDDVLNVIPSPNAKDWVDYVSVAGTFLGGIGSAVAAALSYKAIRAAKSTTAAQIDLQALALKNALYQKRLKVFEAVHLFLYNFQQVMGANYGDIAILDGALMEADFLFDQAIVDFIQNLKKSVLRHRKLTTVINKLQSEQKSEQTLLDERAAIEMELVNVLIGKLKDQFRPYLELK